MPIERGSVYSSIDDLINALANGQNNPTNRIEALGIIQDSNSELSDNTRHWISRLVEMGWRKECDIILDQDLVNVNREELLLPHVGLIDNPR